MLVIEHKKHGAMFCCMSQETIPTVFLSRFRSLADSEVQLHVESLLTHLADTFTALSSEGDQPRKNYSNELFYISSLVELTLPKTWLYQAAKKHWLLQYQT